MNKDIFSNQVLELNSEPDTANNNKVFSINFSSSNVATYQEIKNENFVLNGKNHEFVKLLLECKDKSSIHNSILVTKSQMITGEGLIIDQEKSDISDKEKEEIENWIKINDVNLQIQKLALDYSILGYCFLKITRSKDKKSIAKVEHVDASKIAVGKLNLKTNKSDYYYYSPDLSKYKKEENKVVQLPAFDEFDISQPVSIYMIQSYTTGCVYYPKPDYVAALNWCLIDNEISKFHLANLENGMVPSMWVSFNNGSPSPEEKETIYDEIKSAYGSSENAGKIIVTFSNDKEHSPEYHVLNPNDADKQFIMLNDSVTNQIIRGHRAHPVLFVSQAGSLGQSQEIKNASELFYNQVIAPVQLMFEKVFDKIIELNGYENVKLIIKDSQPLTFTMSESGLLQVLTKDELRQMLGYTPIQSDSTNDKTPLLIESIGIGGTQALVSILSDPNLTNEQKESSLIIIFGLSPEQSKNLVYGNNTSSNIQPSK